MKKNKKLHRHIDYLLNDDFVKTKEIYIKDVDKSAECITAKKLIKKHGREIRDFGCSDCNCRSHLIIKRVENEKHLESNFEKIIVK